MDYRLKHISHNYQKEAWANILGHRDEQGGFGQDSESKRNKKAKLDKWDSIQLKSFCRINNNEVQRHPEGWEESLTVYVSDNRILRIHKKTPKLNAKPTQAGSEEITDLSRHFSKEYLLATNRYKKSCIMLLIIR